MFKKKTLTMIIGIALAWALALSFAACNKDKKSAKSYDYSKILQGDISEFTGTWVNESGSKIQLRADGTFSEGQEAENFEYGKDMLGFSEFYRWTATIDKSDPFARYGVFLLPVGVDFFIDGYTSDKTKVRLIRSIQDVMVSSIYYREGDGGTTVAAAASTADSPVKWNAIYNEDIVEGNKMFVTHGYVGDGPDGDDYMVYSRDGKTWTAATTPFPTNNYYVKYWVYGNNIFVAAGCQRGQDIPPPPHNFIAAYSRDGINWTKANCPMPDQTEVSFTSLTFENGRFVILGTNYVGSNYPFVMIDNIAVSTDGINWTVRENAEPANWVTSGSEIVTGNGVSITSTESTLGTEGMIAYSRDGRTWYVANTPFPKQQNYVISKIIFGDTRFAAVGYQFTGQDSLPSGFKIAYSDDGRNWTEAVHPLSDSSMPLSIDEEKGRVVLTVRSFSGVYEDGKPPYTDHVIASFDCENWRLQ